ncbi:hypothetical protein AAHC03_01233 [Spirometra sp. Aus1]
MVYPFHLYLQMHASLGAIGRRPTVEREDSASLSDSFETQKQATNEEDYKDSVVGSNYATEPLHWLSIGELVECLKAVAKICGTSRCPSTVTKGPKDPSSSVDGGLVGASRISVCPSHGFRCRSLRTFIHSAKRVLWWHAKNVRTETVFSNFVELSNTVDKVTEEEYEKVYYTEAAGGHTLHEDNILTSMSGPVRTFSIVTGEKTRISCVRNICEGLRQGISLISRTHALLQKELGCWVDPDASAKDPFQQHVQSLLLMAVLMAASHLVNAGLFLLTQSELTTYTHNDLWEITRGMEELSMLDEIVQEQMDTQRQQEIRHLLFCRSSRGDAVRCDSSVLYRSLSRAGLLADPVDKLRPASVGHIIYLLAKYRSQVLSRYLSYLILQPPRDGPPEESVCSIIARESVRCEYEFCSNFLDVTSQSTELLRNLRRLQQVSTPSTVEKASPNVRSILCTHSKSRKKSISEPQDEISNAPSGQQSISNEASHIATAVKLSHLREPSASGSHAVAGGKCVAFSKTESMDNFISSFLPVPLTANTKGTQETSRTPISRPAFQTGSHMQLDDKPTGMTAGRRRLIQWSDYCEVSLRHQVVGRYLQLVWTGASSQFDANFQIVYPSVKCRWSTEEDFSNLSSGKPSELALSSRKAWPLLSTSGIVEMSGSLRSLKDIEKLPGSLRRGLLRQADLLQSAAHLLSWDTWVNNREKVVATCNRCSLESSAEQRDFRTFLEDEVVCALEILRKNAYSAFEEVRNHLPQKCRSRMATLCRTDVGEADAGELASARQLRFTLSRCLTSLEVCVGHHLTASLPKPELHRSEDIVRAFRICCELRDCISLAFVLHELLLAHEEATRDESVSAATSLPESDRSALLTSMASARAEYFLNSRFISRLRQDSLVLRKLALWIVTSQEKFFFSQFNCPISPETSSKSSALCRSLLRTLDDILLLFVDNWVPVSKLHATPETETTEHGRSQTSMELDILVSSNAISMCMQALIKITLSEVGRQLLQERSRPTKEEVQYLHDKLLKCSNRLADLPSTQETASILENFNGLMEHLQQTSSLAADPTISSFFFLPSAQPSHLNNCGLLQPSTSTVPITDRGEPKTDNDLSSSSLGPIQTMAKVRKYLTSNVPRNITHASVISRLETLSLNMRSYFTNEDLFTRSPRH